MTSRPVIYLQVGLFFSEGRLGLGHVSHVEEPISTVDVQLSPLTVQSTLNLKLGADQVWVDFL
jgi:hypothetical protein